MPVRASCCLGLLLLLLASCSTVHGEAADVLSQLDLTKATIKPTLSALPADDAVLIEFYASWCPACRCVCASKQRLNSQLPPAVTVRWLLNASCCSSNGPSSSAVLLTSGPLSQSMRRQRPSCCGTAACTCTAWTVQWT